MPNDLKTKLPLEGEPAPRRSAKELKSATKHLPTRLVIVALTFTALMLAWTIWISYDSIG